MLVGFRIGWGGCKCGFLGNRNVGLKGWYLVRSALAIPEEMVKSQGVQLIRPRGPAHAGKG